VDIGGIFLGFFFAIVVSFENQRRLSESGTDFLSLFHAEAGTSTPHVGTPVTSCYAFALRLKYAPIYTVINKVRVWTSPLLQLH
jgi:hypothetical protein